MTDHPLPLQAAALLELGWHEDAKALLRAASRRTPVTHARGPAGRAATGPSRGSPRRHNSGRTHRSPEPAGWDKDREDDVRCDRTTSPRGPGAGRRLSASEAIALLTLDLHPIFRNNRDIDVALRQTLFKAAATGIDVVQIIPGKGTGQLKKRVLAVLAQKHIKKLYVRVETDATNAGRVLVYLR
ncbi:Smr/MutS family protein [Streptomyces mirabilis]|uniref:Smr/MutS family protein n=1 Tax=Streptomyces mirabilis TaxID=68239 RepID=UPI00382E55FD